MRSLDFFNSLAKTLLVVGLVSSPATTASAQLPPKRTPMANRRDLKVPSEDMKPGLPMVERAKKFSPYFMPPPGSIDWDHAELRNLGRKDDFSLRGFITVHPPRGKCLNIQRTVKLPEKRVCQSEVLSFYPEDLANDGSFTWFVTTPDELDSVALKWQTPTRVGIRLEVGEKSPTALKKFLVTSCTVARDARGPMIKLGLTNGRFWTLLFPEQDVLTDQAEELPSLYIQGSEAAAGGIPSSEGAAETPEKKDEGKAQKSPNDGETEKTAKEAGKQDDQKNATGKPGSIKKPSNEKRYQVYRTKEKWTIPRRDAFTLNPANFKTNNETSPVIGACRYQLKGAHEDPQSGWIECHDVGGFSIVFTHLSCSTDLERLRSSTSDKSQNGLSRK